MPVLIHDCSNSKERPEHRGFGGAKENGCVSILKKYAHLFNCEFINSPQDADVVFTNDVFPRDIPRDRKKVKRMDGIFWQSDYLDRNEKLNHAAQIADHVIFVSEYSRRNYYQLYGDPLKNESVALNWVDTNVFYHGSRLRDKPERWLAVATSWERPEKRYNELAVFRSMIDGELTCIGKHGDIDYLEQDELAELMRNSDAFVNFSYRDASPKVVAEAVSCGLPVLYANSGGVPELVPFGVGITDCEFCGFYNKPFSINQNEIKIGYAHFVKQYRKLKDAAIKTSIPKDRFVNMINHYFKILRT